MGTRVQISLGDYSYVQKLSETMRDAGLRIISSGHIQKDNYMDLSASPEDVAVALKSHFNPPSYTTGEYKGRNVVLTQAVIDRPHCPFKHLFVISHLKI